MMKEILEALGQKREGERQRGKEGRMEGRRETERHRGRDTNKHAHRETERPRTPVLFSGRFPSLYIFTIFTAISV